MQMRFPLVSISVVGACLLFNGALAGAQSAGSSAGRAKTGEPVLLIVNHVKADKKQQFENYLVRFWEALDKLSPSDPEIRRISNQTRVLRPAGPDADGTHTFLFVMDPLIPTANYDMASILTKAFGEEESLQLMALFRAAIVEERGQVLTMIQAER